MPERHAARSKARPDPAPRRLAMVVTALSLWMLIVGVRLVYLQTIRHDWLLARARTQQQDAAPMGPSRGLIVDRTGRELARSVEADSFFIVPDEIEDAQETAKRLASILEVDASALAARLTEAKESRRKFTWVARRLDFERAERVRALKLAGVHVLKEPKRHYPNGSLAAHVLGFVGLDGAGLAGIEQFRNAALAGEAGNLLLEGDARRRAYESAEVRSRAGQTIVLTIDQTIQYRAEQALTAAVTRTRARAGTVIVLDPRTGEILAIASAPSFDPNAAQGSAAEMRRNEALQNIYEPGSTFKIVAFSAAMEEKLARPDERIDCQMGAITVAGRIVRDHHPFGTLTLTEALSKSSNVAAIKLGMRVGDERMHDYITRYGFGARTGIELPGETAGLLRPVARWQPSSIGSIAIGQEIGVTPLQMAAAFGAVANDGLRIAPHLVREVRASDGAIVTRANPREKRVTSAETARTLRGMLESVTLSGTAKLAQLDGYTAAGKTGTAQKIDPKTRTYSKTKHVASFVGFAPVENPAVVIVVVIDEPKGAYHGGDVAAPVFREIAESVLPYLSVAPDTEIKPTAQSSLIARGESRDGEGVRASVTSEAAMLPEVVGRGAAGGLSEVVYAVADERALVMPNLRGHSVRDAARVCAQLGLQLEARGEGSALKQFPAPGRSVEAGQVVRIEFGRSE